MISVLIASKSFHKTLLVLISKTKMQNHFSNLPVKSMITILESQPVFEMWHLKNNSPQDIVVLLALPKTDLARYILGNNFVNLIFFLKVLE